MDLTNFTQVPIYIKVIFGISFINLLILFPNIKPRFSIMDVFRKHKRSNHTYFSVVVENFLAIFFVIGSGYLLILLIERL